MTATDLSTDHSRAVADGAHTHGGGIGEAPEASRAARLRSFDVADFPEVTGSEEEWRFSAVDVLAPVLADRAADGHLVWSTTPAVLPAGVTLGELDPAAAVAASVQAPGDRASAIAVARSGGAMALDVAANTEVAEAIEITLTGSGDDVRGHLLITVGEKLRGDRHHRPGRHRHLLGVHLRRHRRQRAPQPRAPAVLGVRRGARGRGRGPARA